MVESKIRQRVRRCNFEGRSLKMKFDAAAVYTQPEPEAAIHNMSKKRGQSKVLLSMQCQHRRTCCVAPTVALIKIAHA